MGLQTVARGARTLPVSSQDGKWRQWLVGL